MENPGLSAQVARHGPQLIHWVARVPDVRAAVASLAAQGIHRGEVIQASRATPSGLLQWQITVRPDGQRLMGGCLPTLIQWGDTHPAASMPDSGVTLQSLTCGTPTPPPCAPPATAWAWCNRPSSRPGAPERPPSNAQGPDRASLRESAFMMHLPDPPRDRSRRPRGLPPFPGHAAVPLGAAKRAPGRRLLGQAREPHAGGRLQDPRRADLFRPAGANRRTPPRSHQRHARQPRPERRLGRARPRRGLHHRRAARQFGGEERRDARPGRDADRTRRRLPGRPRARQRLAAHAARTWCRAFTRR